MEWVIGGAVLYFLLINLIGFLMFGADKKKAEKHQWRISEKSLFLAAAFGGSIGCYIGMFVFHHKTKKHEFLFGIPFIFFFELFLFLGMLLFAINVGTRTLIGFDTVVTETVYARHSEEVLSALDTTLTETEASLSRYREDGELKAVNSAVAAEGKAGLSSDMAKPLLKAWKLCKDSHGALDITMGRSVDLWTASMETKEVPSDDEVMEARSASGYENLSFADEEGKVVDPDALVEGDAITLLSENRDLCLDLGAVGKGIACDAARETLEEEDAKGAVVAVGGSVLVYGKKPRGGPWEIGIQSPDEDTGIMLGSISPDRTCVISTSGDYERYFMADGIRYHHILDPATGWPVKTDLRSVTVVCDGGLESDGLSTACYVLGREESLPLLEQYEAEAVFVTDDTVYVTSGLSDRFRLADDSHRLVVME